MTQTQERSYLDYVAISLEDYLFLRQFWKKHHKVLSADSAWNDPEFYRWYFQEERSFTSDDYESGIQTHQWRLNEPFEGNLIGIKLNSGYGTNYLTNVPRICCHHSPAGHSWGYNGSGCADLALDLLNHHLKEEKTVKCFEGKSGQLAWDLHQSFKKDFIAPLKGLQKHGIERVELSETAIALWLRHKDVSDNLLVYSTRKVST